MIRLNTFITCLFLLFSSVVFSQNEDNKVVISNKEEIYTYESDKNGQIQIKAKFTTTYKSLKSGKASVVEFYDNYSKIEKVKIKGVKGVTPKYGMYNQENIFFSDSRACYFDIPFLKREMEATVDIEKNYNDIRRFTYLFLAEPYFIKSKTVKVIVPDWLKVDMSLRNVGDNITQDVLRDEKNKMTVYTFHLKDQDEFVFESNSTGYIDFYPYLILVPKESNIKGEVVKYFDTMNDLYQWYREPLLLMNNDEETIKEKALELTAGLDSDEDKIRKLSTWVQHNIRYLSYMYGVSAFKPDDAQEVLSKRYGDCKGVSNLLKHLLKAVGFDARLTWVGTNINSLSDVDHETPVPFRPYDLCTKVER